MANSVVWFEITGRDGAGLRSFYGELFGWEYQEVPGADYGMVTAAQPGIPGGVGTADNGPAGLRFYIEVPDHEAVLAQVARLGGRAVLPPTRLAGGTTISLFADPEGNVVGLSRSDPR